jgi:hypothetical protein
MQDVADVMIPEWIKEIAEEDARKEREFEEKRRDTALKNSLLMSSGPPLAHRILKELAVQAIACKAVHVYAVLNNVARESDRAVHQQTFRLEVTANSPWSRTSYADVSYREGERFIHCCPRDSDPFNIELVPDTEGNLVIHSPNGQTATVEKAAEFILKPLLKYVRGK